MENDFEQVGKILHRMVENKIIGQTWLSDEEYQKKLKQKLKDEQLKIY